MKFDVELALNTPIRHLKLKDLYKLAAAGYIVTSELHDIGQQEVMTTYDIAVFLLQFRNRYHVNILEMEMITYSYGASFMENEKDAIKQCRTLIMKGLKRLANGDDSMSITNIISRLEKNYE